MKLLDTDTCLVICSASISHLATGSPVLGIALSTGILWLYAKGHYLIGMFLT
jgi:hypothetical protein